MESGRTFDQISRANLDYFYRLPERAKERQEYIDRGLIPTNNLSLYFYDSSHNELAPGIPNPHDYREKPFGPLIQAFREAHPDLWEEAKVTASISGAIGDEYWNLLVTQRDRDRKPPEQPTTEQPLRKRLFARIFKAVVPEVEPPAPTQAHNLLDEEVEAKKAEVQTAYWKHEEVFNRVFKILAPQLEAAGIDPLDVCR